ncbi:hypothetical protein QUC31_009689 [Theobroma cacao]
MPGSMNMELEHGATSLMVDGKVSVEKVMEHGESELGETIDTTIYKSRELKVDVKCAGLSAPSNQGQRQKEMARKTKISHFSHDHMLVAKCSSTDIHVLDVMKPVLDPSVSALRLI